MKDKRITTALTMALLLVPWFFGIGQEKTEDGWSFVTEKDGISVYTRTVPGYEYNEVMGIGIIDAPFDAASRALLDMESYPKYFKKIKIFRVLEKIDKNRTVVYSLIDSPWPVDDRDVVAVKTVKRTKDRLILHAGGLNNYHSAPQLKDGVVRITTYEEIWSLQPEGNRTNAVYRAKIDPAGYVPVEMVSLFSDSSTIKTINTFREMVKDYL